MRIATDIQVLLKEFASLNNVGLNKINCLQVDSLPIRFNEAEVLSIKTKPEYKEAEALIPTEGVKLVSFWLAN